MEIVKQNPFLGLKPYESGDRKKLYGRNKDLLLMKDRIFSGRTTLLFAGSGVGKTSFLNAKVIPELESKYDIVYHNQWAIDEPLAAVMNSIRVKLRSDSRTPAKSLTATDSASLLDHLNAFTQPVSEDGSNVASHRCLMILDQFEEVFPHHSHQRYFAKFVQELAELINSDCNVRLLFSMRDDFLGGLSVFDNKIPNLFSNYYHLKCPSAEEAEDIIHSTSNFVGVPVNEDNLKLLVHDLAQIKGSESVTEGAVPGETALAWDIVEPPALQIACKRLWERQFNARNDAGIPGNGGDAVQESFLADYQAGEAQKMVDLFFRETLASLGKRERALVADSFDYLVTKKGAKMAYELNMLTGHMNVEESALRPVLEKLSEPETRILRQSDGPHKSVWFELYHDMYGPISDKWKQDYRRQQKAGRHRAIKTAVAVVVVAMICIWAYWHWWATPRQYETKLRDAKLWDAGNYIASKQAFDSLRLTWGGENKAKRLWADAWKRRADFAEKDENPDEALLSWLTAAKESPSDNNSALPRQIGSYLISDSYRSLVDSFGVDRDTNRPADYPLFSAEGKTIISVVKGGQLVRWDIISTELAESTELRKSPPLSVAYPITLREPPSKDLPVRTIQAAAGNLIGGVAKNKFYIWLAKTGEQLWESEFSDPTPTQSGPPTGQDGYYTNSANRRQADISFSPDGHYFAISDPQGAVQIYNVIKNDTETNKPNVVLTFSPKSAVAKLQFSPDNHSVLLLFENDTLEVRNLKTGGSRTAAVSSKSSISGVSFSPDGSKFLVSFSDLVSSHAQIWNSESGKLVATIDQRQDPRASFNFWSDSKTIVASYFSNQKGKRKDLTIRFLKSEPGSVEGVQTITLGNLESYFVDPAGKYILTYSPSGIARLWNLTPSKPDPSQIQMKPPVQLLEEWTKKLALVFDHNGQLKPYIQVPNQ